MNPPQIVKRPAQLRAPITSVAELDRAIAAELDRLSADAHDYETIAHIGADAHQRAVGASAALTTLRSRITGWALDEQADAEQAAIEDAWKRMRDSGADELTMRRLAGDR